MTKHTLDDTSKRYLDSHPEFTRAWIDGLRSGKYKQTQNRMCDSDMPNSACCLHVMEMCCNGAEWEDGIGLAYPMPSAQFRFSDGEPPQSALRTDRRRCGPQHWNDVLGLSFAQIADLLEHGEVESDA